MKHTEESINKMSTLDRYFLCVYLYNKIADLSVKYDVPDSWVYDNFNPYTKIARLIRKGYGSGFYISKVDMKKGMISEILKSAISEITKRENYEEGLLLVDLIEEAYVQKSFSARYKKAATLYAYTNPSIVDYDKMFSKYSYETDLIYVVETFEAVRDISTSDMLNSFELLNELRIKEKIIKKLEKTHNANDALRIYNTTKCLVVRGNCARIILYNFRANTFLNEHSESLGLVGQSHYEKSPGIFIDDEQRVIFPTSTLEGDRIDKLSVFLED
jgi:hypothetical protein